MHTNYLPKCIELDTKNSSAFALSSNLVIFKKYSVIHDYRGKNLFSCHVFRNIWTSKWLYLCKRKIFFITNSKNTSSTQKNWAGDFLELWQHDLKNNIKKKSTVYLSILGEIWDFECNIFYKSKKKSSTLAVCCGFKIFFFNLPFSIFQFAISIKGVLSISLINIYQWKMDCIFFNIVTGDIYGNIIIYNFSKNFSITRIFYNLIQNIPISTLGLFLKNFPIENRFIISGGYDGFVKIWDRRQPTKAILCVCILKRRITNIFVNFQKHWQGIILLCFENSFFAYWSVFQNIFFGFGFFYQMGVWKIFKKSENLFFAGEDGTVNVIRFHLLSCVYKKLFFNKKNNFLFINARCIANRSWNGLRSTTKTFSLICIQMNLFIQENYILNFGGNRGIFFFYKCNLEKRL